MSCAGGEGLSKQVMTPLWTHLGYAKVGYPCQALCEGLKTITFDSMWRCAECTKFSGAL